MILIAYECSGSLRDAFLNLGINAMSCDIKPTEVPGPHFSGKVENLFKEKFDFVFAFPPCKYLCGVQLWRCNANPIRKAKQLDAIDHVRQLYANFENIVIENPIGILSRALGRPNQIVHPYNFGDPYSKNICLWMKNMPALMLPLYNPVQKSISNHVNSRMSQALKSSIRSSWSRYPKMCESIASQYAHLTQAKSSVTFF